MDSSWENQGISGQILRLREFIPKIGQEQGRSLIVEHCDGLYGIQYANAKGSLDSIVQNPIDALILSPGHARRHFKYFTMKKAPALIIRADWANHLWVPPFSYPRQQFRHVMVCSAKEALRLGASAVVMDVFYGMLDEQSTEDMQHLRDLISDGSEIGLPIIANIVPLGDRVDAKNFADVALLGARMCLELGANAAGIPLISPEHGKKIIESTLNSPIFVNTSLEYQELKTNSQDPIHNTIEKLLPLGFSGCIINGHRDLGSIKDFIRIIHP